MMKIPLLWAAAAIGAAISFSSCAYDPYYSSAGGYYGYGDGYGYGGSGFSTSIFVGTGDPRWGYDPYCHSYYDYWSHRYYDPYLYGYYPVGYRPTVVIGVPHPYGWRAGHGYCPPPRSVRNVTVANYRNRESAYRNSNYSWARQVRVQPRHAGSQGSSYPRTSSQSLHPSSSYNTYNRNHGNPSSSSRYPSGSHQSPGAFDTRNGNYSNQNHATKPDYRKKSSNGLPSYYNTPVTRTPHNPSATDQRTTRSRNVPVPSSSPSSPRHSNRSSQPSSERGKPDKSRDDSQDDSNRPQGPRHRG